MNRNHWILAIIFMACTAGALPAQTSAAGPRGGTAQPELLPAGGAIESAGMRIQAPGGWRRMEYMESESTILHLVGDGMGLPPMDEHGGPLRTGMAVERRTGKSAAALTAELERAAGRTLLRPVEKEEVELGGGARGTVLYTHFKKDGGGKGLYEQLVVADPREGAWLVTFWIVASTDSSLPARGSGLEARLAWYLRSFELTRPAGD